MNPILTALDVMACPLQLFVQWQRAPIDHQPWIGKCIKSSEAGFGSFRLVAPQNHQPLLDGLFPLSALTNGTKTDLAFHGASIGQDVVNLL